MGRSQGVVAARKGPIRCGTPALPLPRRHGGQILRAAKCPADSAREVTHPTSTWAVDPLAYKGTSERLLLATSQPRPGQRRALGRTCSRSGEREPRDCLETRAREAEAYARHAWRCRLTDQGLGQGCLADSRGATNFAVQPQPVMSVSSARISSRASCRAPATGASRRSCTRGPRAGDKP